MMEVVTTLRILGVFVIAIFGILSLIVWRRLFIHPLSHIPGPKLAASTWLYQTYYSLWDESKYYLQIAKLHDIYGTAFKRSPPQLR
jgi:hypothetical protein